VTNAEKAEEFTGLLSHWPSILTVCVSKDCVLADHLRSQYPDMITLEWGLDMPELAVTELGISGTLTCGCVFVPWDAIVNVYTPGARPTISKSNGPRKTVPAPRLKLIRGGKA